jgi:Xaa-Pro aminopeptidase
MADRRRERLAALGEALSEEHIDALILTSLPNIRYLTGFSGTSALAIVTANDIRLITDFRYETQVADEVGDFAQVRIESVSLWTGLCTRCNRQK